MTKIFCCLALLMLSGCATVSMVSEQAIVETTATAEQSEMRKTAAEFETLAETEGWVGESRGLAGIASMLFGSKSDNSEPTPVSYSERVTKDAKAQAVYQTIASDARRATQELSALQAVADDVLATGIVDRADLMSFEGALVTAQKSYRSFAEATGRVEADNKSGAALADAALKDFAAAIDTARKSADTMADVYADESANSALTS
ncbi:hypothetical protein [Henriciella litoralis]|uniref:hypothetical protein n=1 Tax=Henriciella litoralis TaxID=568102 RepID=UPI000A03D1B0|nr:hypothetical protein [Henriciella litoralis]